MRLLQPLSIALLCGILVLSLLLPQWFSPDADTDYSLTLPEQKIQIPSVEAEPASPKLSATYACVMDADSGRILYGRGGDTQAPMASTTKIMTALLALESGRTDETVTVSAKAASMPKVHLGMQKGMKFKMKDLLYSLMLESHNDTAVAIAEHLGGSVAGFAKQMNRRAKELGMTKTHFVTPNGLDAEGHYSCASDMCRLAAYAIQNPDFLALVQTLSYSFSDLSGKHSYSLTNRDAFLSYYDGALGIKTGFTGNAGYCFVGAARRGDKTLTSCVLACGWPPNKSWKWTDTKALMDYGMSNFSTTELPVQNLSAVQIPVTDGKKEWVGVTQPDAPTTLLSASDSLTVTYDLPDSVAAPVRTDVALGTVSFYINDELWCEEKIFPSEAIEKSVFSDTMNKVWKIWMESFSF